MKLRSLLAFGLVLAASLPAATPLFDFELEADVAAWNWASKGQSSLARATDFATAGSGSLRFASPTWSKGQPEWPAFEAKPPVTDWRPFDRLVVDITNPNEARGHFALFASDTKVPFRKGLSYRFELPSRGFKRFVVPLSAFPKEVDRSDIAILHFFTERPATDLTLYLDNLTLVRAGEALPEPGAGFVRQLAALSRAQLNTADQALARCRDRVESVAVTPELRASAQVQLARLAEALTALGTALAAPELTLARLNALNEELAAWPGKADRTLSILRLQRACHEAGLPTGPLLVCPATSMEKLLPREVPFDLKPSRTVHLSLARNETESLQVAVLPMASLARNVTVRASDLKSASGAIFPASQIQCDVMGYVRTQSRPPYDVSHVGWWPDPILNFLGPIEIAAGDLQSFWVRFRAPTNQPAGDYAGTLSVRAEGVTPVTLELNLHVHGFSLPSRSPLPLTITFSPEDNPITETREDQAAWRRSPEYPVNSWRKHKLRWADFLADYYISYDSLYHHGMPDFEVLTRLKRQGRLDQFNLGYYGHPGAKAEEVEQWKTKQLPRLREAYRQAKELGLLEHAYLYGCDEANAELFPLVERAASILKAEFPDVPVRTTTYDQTYGTASVIRSMDGFCPLTPSFDPAKAAAARAAGKSVWWYICCGPHHPHANMFIEYPAIEGRLLMGAQTVRQRPDGFLYYQISIWNSRLPITRGPFTDWDPRSWTTYHGDGSWTCVGPDGTPLPTIRLENFRDGLEDYAYAVILEHLIRQRQTQTAPLTASEKQWLTEAQAALPVPETLVKSMTEYSRDPALLYSWRNRLGTLIDQAGQPEVDPWNKPLRP